MYSRWTLVSSAEDLNKKNSYGHILIQMFAIDYDTDFLVLVSCRNRNKFSKDFNYLKRKKKFNLLKNSIKEFFK